MLFIVAAVVLLIHCNNKIKTKLGIRESLMLLIGFATHGPIKAAQKMFTSYVPGGNFQQFAQGKCFGLQSRERGQ